MTSATLNSIPVASAPSAKDPVELLRTIEELRSETAALIEEVFPGNLKRYAITHLPETTISKAREGYVCSAYFRASLYILALRVSNGPRARERAQQLVDRLQCLVHQWFPEEDETPLEDLFDQESDADTAEDRAGDRLLMKLSDRERRREYVKAARRHVSILPRVIKRVEAMG